ncbi:MAG: hypothetical protein OEV91_07885 [Desulfobulbaceae bacterium]|nr:hypothetical protein [Desulfobulbaceae bacterium]
MSGFSSSLEPLIGKKIRRTGGGALADARIDLRVDCEAGYGGEETPCRFHLHQRCRQVNELLDRWLNNAGDRHFKVKGDDGGLYVLRHEVATDRWELVLYAGGEC